MNKLGVIYKHTNKYNYKSYIGQTINIPAYRWNKGEGYKDSPLFYNAICKYGWESFIHEIIESDVPIEKLNKREQYWIDFYKTNQREHGYNLTSGGTGKLSKEQKEHRKQKLQEWRNQNPEIAQKSIDSMQQYWKNHPEEKQKVLTKAQQASQEYWKNHPKEKQQIMLTMREKAKQTNIKPVKCIETNKTYESAREASRQTGIHYSNIGKVCSGKQKTAGGYHWCFINKEEYLKERCKLEKEMDV